MTTVRYTGFGRVSTGLPIIPNTTDAPVAGDVFPHSRAIGRASIVDGAVPVRTWVAQDTGLGWYQAVKAVGNNTLGVNAARYYVCNPGLVDWASVIRTGRAPQNPEHGFRRWSNTIATATLKNGGITLATGAVSEENERILVGNSLVDASKVPPLCYANDVGLNMYNSSEYYSSTPIPHPSPRYGAFRWLGGALSVVCLNGTGTWTIRVVPINTGTYTDDIASSALLGTCPNNAGATFSAAALAAAGVVRWGQFWVYSTMLGGPLATINYRLFSPFDLPPPYDCNGLDVPELAGGYLV